VSKFKQIIMGYDTQSDGILKFKNELTIPQLTKIRTFLGEDCREHPEWGKTNLTYIDLELSKDYSGLKWDGSEKTYDLKDKINLIITEMKKSFPDFELEGHLLAQGDSIEDRYYISIENGLAIESDLLYRITNLNEKCKYTEEEFIDFAKFCQIANFGLSEKEIESVNYYSLIEIWKNKNLLK